MGIAFSMPVFAYADGDQGGDITLNPSNDDRSNDPYILHNLYEAFRAGFLPYDNVQTIAGQQGISEDDWNNYDGNSYETPTPDEGDSEGPQVGDTFIDGEGNTWVVVARPENGYKGAEITNLYDAMRFGFILVPGDNGTGGNDGNENPGGDNPGNNDPDTPSNPDTPGGGNETQLIAAVIRIDFAGDEGNEDKRPESVIVNIYGQDGSKCSEVTVGKDSYEQATVYVPSDGLFTVQTDAVDNYNTASYEGAGSDEEFTFTLTLSYSGVGSVVEPIVDDNEENKKNAEGEPTSEPVKENPVKEDEKPSEKKSEETPEVAEVKDTKRVSSDQNLPKMGDVVSTLGVAITTIASGIACFITRRLGA